jgi:uncharacterized membrane protein
MILDHFITIIVPYVIHTLEFMGIMVIIAAAIRAFIQYARKVFCFADYRIKLELAKALAFALELKLGSEILKTVIIRTIDEMYILAAIIALRAVLTFVIHWEIELDTKHSKEQTLDEDQKVRRRRAS